MQKGTIESRRAGRATGTTARNDLLDVSRLEADAGRARLSVSDEGPGIAVDDQARLFERFFRPPAGQQASQHGLGLGLYISRGIARAHGGELYVSSTPGQGSTFTLELPIFTEPPTEDGTELEHQGGRVRFEDAQLEDRRPAREGRRTRKPGRLVQNLQPRGHMPGWQG